MKPSVTVDERGVLLHMTDTNGRGVAVALNTETLHELTHALERLKEPQTRSELFWSVGRSIVRELLGKAEKKDDGTTGTAGASEPEPAREKDR